MINILVRRHRESSDPNHTKCSAPTVSHEPRVTYTDVDALCEHRDAWEPQERQAWKHVATSAFNSLQASVVFHSSITEDFILRLISQIENNSFAMLAGGLAIGRCT